MSISEILPEEKRRLHELELKLVELEKDNNVQASDIYSLALVFWEILSGKVPFSEIKRQDDVRIDICTSL